MKRSLELLARTSSNAVSARRLRIVILIRCRADPSCWLFSDHQYHKSVGQDCGPGMRVGIRRRRRRPEFCRNKINLVGLRIQNHSPCTALRGNILYYHKLPWRIFVRDRERTVAARSKS